jgi:hypothetical protein
MNTCMTSRQTIDFASETLENRMNNFDEFEFLYFTIRYLDKFDLKLIIVDFDWSELLINY